ncbi:MAG TPA: cell division protein FtsA, partial [Verrucomicrobiae bacterium]|nr:cell division protein FtsA [Verrucomicrobiae bacterium]
MAVKPIYAVGLDTGSSRTRLVVCALENGRLRLLGSAAVESHGWLKGRIANQKEVTESILAALGEAERSSGISIDSAVVGVGGPTVRGANTRGAVELGFTREIEQRDVNRAVDRALKVQMPEDRMILQLFPQDCVVDGHPGHRDPRKMMASTLELNAHLLIGAVQEHHTLVGAVNQAHLTVEETVFEAFASWYACVPEEDRREGLAVVDIGSQSTEMVVYYSDAMQLSSSVPLCGDHFTRDLAQGLTLSFDDAEILKLDYGCAISHDTPENVFVELPTPSDREPRFVRRKTLNAILEARAEELFRYVRAELVRASMEHALVGGVYLTGSAARLPDLWDVAERELQCQA